MKTSTGIYSVQYNAENRPITFTNSESNMVVECTYDCMERRATKKVESNGETTLHQRYLYRGYLQVAACDLTRTGHPCLWLILWDPTQPIATRPLSIQKDGTWYCYGWDLTKNICEVYGSNGYVRTAYTYTPYGSATSTGDVTQPLQWSSEYTDEELGLTYYNYRHYNSSDGRWLGRDKIGEQSNMNLWNYVNNHPIDSHDILGNSIFTIKDQENSIGGFGAGHEIHIRTKSYIRLGNEPFYMLYIKYSQGRKHPAKGRLWIISKKEEGKIYHLDIDRKGLHHNVRGGIEKVKGFAIDNHSRSGATIFGETIVVFKYAGRALFFAGIAMSAYDIYHAEDRKREVVRQVGGWTGATSGAILGTKAGVLAGASVGSIVAGGGAAPGAVAGGFIGGIIGGAIGWWAGTKIAETLYDWVFNPLEKEEYVICKEE